MSPWCFYFRNVSLTNFLIITFILCFLSCSLFWYFTRCLLCCIIMELFLGIQWDKALWQTYSHSSYFSQNNTWQRNDYLNPHRNLQKTIERFRTNDSRLHETVSLESTESFRKQSNVSESFRIERTILQENNRTLGFFFSYFCGLVARLKYDGLVKVIKNHLYRLVY